MFYALRYVEISLSEIVNLFKKKYCCFRFVAVPKLNYGISYSVQGQGFAADYIAFNSQGAPGTFQGNGNPCPSTGGAVFQPYDNNASAPVSLSFGTSPSQLTFYIYPQTGLVSYNGSLQLFLFKNMLSTFNLSIEFNF